MPASPLDGLKLKHAELSQQRDRLLDQVDAMEADMVVLLQAMRIMDPAAAPPARGGRATSRRPGTDAGPVFGPHEFSRLTMAAIRHAPTPFTSTAISVAVAAAKGGEAGGCRPPAISGRISATLAGFIRKGVVERVGGDAQGRTLYRVAA